MTRILAFIFIFASCSQKKTELTGQQFFEGLYQTFITTTEITYLNRSLVNSDQEIKSPSNAWQTLFNIKTIKAGSWFEENYCLFYKIPYQELVKSIKEVHNIKKVELDPHNLGILKLIKLPQGKDCAELFNHSPIQELGHILSLKSYFNYSREVTLKIQYIDTTEMRLKNTTWTFPFYNLLPGKIVGEENYLNESWTKNSPGSSSISLTKVPGLKIQGISLQKNSNSGERNIMLGKFDDSYQDKNLIRCHELNENCEVVQHFRCDQCRYGWFETVGGKCPGIKDKFCGVSHCGEKGEPACPRGNSYNQFDSNLNCADDSQAGFCAQGLKTFCENNVLICL